MYLLETDVHNRHGHMWNLCVISVASVYKSESLAETQSDSLNLRQCLKILKVERPLVSIYVLLAEHWAERVTVGQSST